MADISLICNDCGRENVLSQYTTADSRVCSGCGNILQPGNSSDNVALKLNRIKKDEKISLQGKPMDIAAPAKGFKPVEVSRPIIRLPRAPSALMGALIFLFLGGLMVGAQYLGQTNSEIMEIYLYARYALLGVALLLIIIEAFYENQVQGFLVLLIPVYLVWYALTRMQCFWKQAIFFVAMLMLGMELYFLIDQSLLISAHEGINSAIEMVGGQVRRAGDAPIPSL